MDIERVVVRMIADASQYNRALGAMEGRLLAFAQRSTMLGASLSTPFIVAAGAVTGVTTAMVGAGTVALKLAADYQQAAIAFEVMTGGANTAKDILRQINQLAIETPFRSGELQEGAKQLKAFGFATDQLLPTLTALGEVSSGTGTKMERIILAFGQVRVAGRLMGPEVRQMVDAGIPIFEYLAKVMNKPVTAIKGLVEEGKVGFPDVVRAFNAMTQQGGIFFNMMERQSQTAMGRWSAFVETLEIGLRDLGLAFFEGFGVADVLEDFRKATAQGFDRDRVLRFFQEMRRGFDDFRAFLHMLGEWIDRNYELLKLIGQITLAITAFWVVMAGLRITLALLIVPLTTVANTLVMMVRILGMSIVAFALFDQVPVTFESIKKVVNDTVDNFTQYERLLKQIAGTLILVTAGFYAWRLAIVAVNTVLIAMRTLWMAITAAYALFQTVMITLSTIGTIVGGISIGVTALGLALPALFMTATTGLGFVLYRLYELGAFDLSGFFNRMGQMFQTLLDIGSQTVKGIRAAFESGDMELAGKIFFKGLETGFRVIVGEIKKEWLRLQEWIKDPAQGAAVEGVTAPGAAMVEETARKAYLALRYATGADEETVRREFERIEKDSRMKEEGLRQMARQARDAHRAGIEAKLQPRFAEIDQDVDKYRRQLDELVNKAVNPTRPTTGVTPEVEEYQRMKGVADARTRVFTDAYVRQWEEATYEEWRKIALRQRLAMRAAIEMVFGGPLAQAFDESGVTNAITRGMRRDQVLMRSMNEAVRRASFAGIMQAVEYAKLPPNPGIGSPLGAVGGGLSMVLAGNTAGRAAPAMRIDHVPSTEVHELVKDLRREFEKEQTQGIGTAGGQIGFFYKQMDLLKEGLVGPLGKMSDAMSAITGVGMTAGLTARHGLIDDKLYDFGMVRNFNILRDWVKRQEHEDVTVRAYAKGTSEAMDVINKNLYKPQTAMEQVRDILLRGEKLEEEKKRYADAILEALKQIAAERGMTVKLGGFGPNDERVAPMPRAKE